MDPNVAFILMSLGMLALWAEFNHPGAILPGVVGLIAIVLARVRAEPPADALRRVRADRRRLRLFALEAKFASYGVLGTGGVICLVFGALLLVDGPIPEMRVQLAHGARRERADRRDRRVPDVARPARARNPVATGHGRDDRPDRHRAHERRRRRQGVRARRALERRCEERPSPREHACACGGWRVCGWMWMRWSRRDRLPGSRGS